MGAVWTFNYAFKRERTGGGFWFVRNVDWHLEGREIILGRVMDYHETRTDVQNVGQRNSPVEPN